ncbi:MAG: short-chain fatty acyl-CoA regulator family protein [Robiginitomaculum sp.]|nr:short-chain fatty acyl-CoA regulator family protein [Robiginitomaculum sp.]
MTRQKLMIGPRVRQLRQSFGLTQAAMAGELGISTSYMNLIERNQRPMSAKILLRLAEVYDIDIAKLSPESDAKMVQELARILKNPAYGSYNISSAELRDSVGVSPDFARAFIALHSRAEELTLRASMRDDPLADRGKVELLEESAGAVENVRRFIHDTQNYFDEIDKAAENLADDLGLNTRKPHTALTVRLLENHEIKVRIVPAEIIPGRLSQFDPHKRRLNLSELLPQSGRRFRIAYQLGLLEHRSVIEATVRKAILPSKEADDLARLSLANYFAAAVLMPYGRFLKTAQDNHYDVELLTRRFDTSYEQTAHRLTTMQRKGARGVPFFFVRVDMAGNISKRFSAGKFHFSRFGGACPLWNIHACFQTPGETIPQVIEMPDGIKYFSVARAVLRPEGAHGQHAQMVAIGLGCELKYADELVYAGNFTPTPIGVNCYLCERPACRSRAHAPINKKLRFDERTRDQSIFQFDG